MPSVLRPDYDHYFMAIAAVVATRSTCRRRAVGAVLVSHRKHILSTGYNGPPHTLPNCTDIPCPGFGFKSGEGLDKCEAVHAEQNALLQCPDVDRIHTLYCTTAPCMHCTKMLLNTQCGEIVFLNDYPHSLAASNLWQYSAKRLWRRITNVALVNAVNSGGFSSLVGGSSPVVGPGDPRSEPHGERSWGPERGW